ncbi:uncharacterized protein PAC_10171 [Phialocephala subalpina]|uniref:Protein kinase domain-containing protein n=1 Tax=Phialocephala subalpina TaxID=576137 RepID=A0A1L7X5J4_9HELO|nr:uncharacterized protein PAC_10171 [Phialocephala subalpina]
MHRLPAPGSCAAGPSSEGLLTDGRVSTRTLGKRPQNSLAKHAEEAVVEDDDDEPYPDSFVSYSQRSKARSSTEEPCDFIGMISMISEVYRRGIYIKMLTLDYEDWEELEQGATFHVSRSEYRFSAVSSTNNRIKETVTNKLVLKRTLREKVEVADIRSFFGELRVLDHFHAHPFIVKLRGIGWFDDLSDDLVRTPRPALLLEEASNTLSYLVGPDVSLEFQDKLRILAEVGSALEALHRSRIAHGDVKPANVLLFRTLIPREGILVDSYVAKLSDFGSAMFDTGFSQPFPLGTLGYTAPEIDSAAEDERVTFQAILQTDVWSFGVIPQSRVESIYLKVNQILESSAAEPAIMRDIHALLNHSVAVLPHRRRLDYIVDKLDCYQFQARKPSYDHPGNLPSAPGCRLTISYENFKHLAGSIKDFIVQNLEAVAGSNDTRSSMASWELGVIYLSHFADPDSSIENGLGYIRRSAELGDPRAKALAHRLHEAFDSRCIQEIPHHTRLEWLQDAVCAGSPVATAELTGLDSSLAEKARASHAAFCYDAVRSDIADKWDASVLVSERGDTALHQFAATGRVSDVESLLTNDLIDIDARNEDGETPLLSACRFGQSETALLLMHNGVDASIVNNLGENGLHFAWCFDTASSVKVVEKLITNGASLEAKSIARYVIPGLDLLPITSGTPIQRAAARRRLDLVLLFQEYENNIDPGNGNTARRMLVWALRLHDTELLEFMLSFSTHHESRRDDLTQISDTKWLYRGEQLSLLGAGCAGWVSGTQNGCDLPLRFWLACSFGKAWRSVIRASFDILVEFLKTEHIDLERSIDDAILWAFRESQYDTMTTLLHLKFEKTDGLRSRLPRHDVLNWTLDAINLSIIRPQEAHLIDLIFYDVDRGTLAQQSLVSGDRYMFRLLTQCYHANAALPAPAPTAKARRLTRKNNILGNKMNLYSVLAYTVHRDTWFANELQRLQVLPTCPWESLPIRSVTATRDRRPPLYIPPLLHAVGTHSWVYFWWLINSCASIEEEVTPGLDILGAIMATRSLETIRFFFKGVSVWQGGAALLPSQYREAGGYFVFRLFYDARNLDISIVRQLDGDFLDGYSGRLTRELRGKQQEDQTQCFKYLLRKYPDAANSLPAPSLLGIIPRAQLSILYQASNLGSGTSYLKLVVETWKTRATEFPKQDLLSYFWSSPLDRLYASEMKCVLKAGPDLNYRHICPSLLWFKPYFALIGVLGIALLFIQYRFAEVISTETQLVDRFLFLTDLMWGMPGLIILMCLCSIGTFNILAFFATCIAHLRSTGLLFYYVGLGTLLCSVAIALGVKSDLLIVLWIRCYLWLPGFQELGQITQPMPTSRY